MRARVSTVEGADFGGGGVGVGVRVGLVNTR